jgi:hypothetical protein
MTLTAWPINGYASDGEVIRQAYASLIDSAGGLVAAGGLELKQKATPNMSVQIKGGTPAEGGLWIPGYTATTGPTYFQNSATYEQPIEAAGATNPRIDTIVARIYDTSLDSSGKHEPEFEALKGKEESGVTLAVKKSSPAIVPKNCYALGYVLVPAKAASIVTADIENVATQVALGLNAATYREGTAAERPSPGVKGREWRATDTGAISIDTGTAWVQLSTAVASAAVTAQNANLIGAVTVDVVGTRAFAKGTPKAEPGIVAPKALFTVPVGARPSATQETVVFGVPTEGPEVVTGHRVIVHTTGIVELESTNFATNEVIFFNSLNWPIS